MDRRWAILFHGTTAPHHRDNDNIDGDNERGGDLAGSFCSGCCLFFGSVHISDTRQANSDFLVLYVSRTTFNAAES